MRHFHYRTATILHRNDRPNLPWVVRWRNPRAGQPGQPRRLTRAFPTRSLALAFRRKLEESLNCDVTGAASVLWLDAVQLYEQATQHHARSTAYDCMTVLGRLARLLAPDTLDDATPARIDEYFARRRSGWPATSRGFSVGQHRKEWAYLHAFFGHFVRRGELASNPLDSVVRPAAESIEVRVPSDDEWLALLHGVERVENIDRQSWHLYILAAVCTGLDQADLLRLTWRSDQLTLGDKSTGGVGLLAIQRTKTGKLNYLGLPAELTTRLANRFAALPDGADRVFPWRTFQRRQWAAICQTAHFSYPFKALRRAAGTRRAESAAYSAAAQQLGHSSPRVSERHYVADRRVALAVAAGLRLPALPPLPAYSPPGPAVGIRRRRGADSGTPDQT